MWAGQNDTIRFADVPDLGVDVQRGPTFDGLGRYYRDIVEESAAEPVDVVAALREPEPTCWSPTSRSARSRRPSSTPRRPSKPEVGFVNSIPVFIASDPEWARRFVDAGVPIIGDDIKSQVGATIVHRNLARLFEDRGRRRRADVPAERRRQHGLQEHARAGASRVEEDLEDPVGDDPDRPRHRQRHVHIGPSDHVPWLTDRKWAYIRVEGRAFGDVPLNAELKLEVWDSPNSAGVVIDAVRCIKLAMDRGVGGPLLAPSSYFMKSPPVQYRDDTRTRT